MTDAQYSGTCKCGCNTHFLVGTPITYSFVHEGYILPNHPPKVGEICPTCFMAKSITGECGNCD